MTGACKEGYLSSVRHRYAVLFACVALLCCADSIVFFGKVFAQELSLPSRSLFAVGGTAFGQSISSLSRADREEVIFTEVMAGNVPDFIRHFTPVTLHATIAGIARSATIFVLPNYLAIGSDSDYLLMPMSPILAQRICSATGCILPTKRMVDAIYVTAPVKQWPQPIAPSAAMITVPVFMAHNDSVATQRKQFFSQWPLESLTGGTKKDVIVSNYIYYNLKPNVPRPVVIYGWHRLNGSPIQPVYNGHEETYADYSHGIRLVLDSVMVDGVATTVTKVLRDSTLASLLSDEGVIERPGYGMYTDVQEDDERGDATPHRYGVDCNYPNPFNGTTTIPFTLDRSESVKVEVFDLLGREVRTVFEGTLAAGTHSVGFDARGLTSGTYVLRLETSSFVQSRKVCLVQ